MPEVDEPLQLLVNASATLLGPLDLDQLLPRVLELARKLNAADACAIWRRNPETDSWSMASSFGLSPEAIHTVLPSRPTNFLGDSTLYFEDVFDGQQIAVRRAFYESEGIRSMALAPLIRAGRVFGTLVFYYRRPHSFAEAEKSVIEALGHLASAAMERAELQAAQERSRREAEEARVRAAFLAEASAVLASSLNYETTLAAVARLAVPSVADWCIVDIHEGDGRLKLIEVAHADPEKVRLAMELRNNYPSDPESPSGSQQVIRTGNPIVVPEITPAMLSQAARDEEHRRSLLQLGFTSWMCIPMSARGRVVGAISFVSATPNRYFGPEDLALAQDLAGRAAVAIDNAMLYAGAQRERTALEVALAALRENEDRLLIALEAGKMGIWEWDIAEGSLTWSESLQEMNGVARSFDGRYETLLGMIHPEDRALFEAGIERSLRSRANFEVECRMVRPDGTVRWQSARGRVLSGEDGTPAKMIGVASDVTDRRMLEEKLRESQKLESVGLLAGGIAHDFNNLLTGILGNSSLALEIVPERSEAAPLLRHVVQAGERAADLTQQLLAYAGKGRFVIETVDLSALVREIAGLVHASIPKLVRVELELDANLPPIEADSSQLQQVTMNLVINAAESMDGRAGTVQVRTLVDEESGNVCLEVRDEGCGMEEATLARIFDPFFSTKFTGRGLGLAAVSGIVRAHNGSIQVTSRPGQGSLFRVMLPPAVAQVPAGAEQPGDEDLYGTGRVLVIDDQETVRIAASAALEHFGYEAVTAADGAEGVAILRERPGEFDAVLLDLTMPVMDGGVAIGLIREVCPEIPVIASSGYSEMEAARAFPARQVAAFLQKPYTASGLAAALKSALARNARGASR